MVFTLFLILVVLACALAVGVIALRLFGVERVGPLTLAKPMALSGEAFTRRDGVETLAWALGMIGLTFGVSLLWCGIFGGGVTLPGFYDAWDQYDAYHYLRLAEQGYSAYTEGGKPLFLVFFPLYPWLVRAVHVLIPDWQLCGHLVSALSYAGACLVFAKLVTEEFGRKTARLALLFLTAYPFAFFFCSCHTESLFLLLSVACFYCIRRHRWLGAGVLGALAALTRMQGVFLAVVAFGEYWVTDRPVDKARRRDWKGLGRDFCGKILPMVLMAVGTLVYLGLNRQVAGDPFAFTAFQRERWNQGFAPMTYTLTALKNALFGEQGAGYEFVPYTTWGPQLALFVVCMVVLLYGLRRLPPTYMLYYAICLFLNYSLRNPLSCCRYMACAFPMPILLAVGSCRRPMLGKFAAVVCGVLYGVFLLAYCAGKHVC